MAGKKLRRDGPSGLAGPDESMNAPHKWHWQLAPSLSSGKFPIADMSSDLIRWVLTLCRRQLLRS
jgi:hypothetical protein